MKNKQTLKLTYSALCLSLCLVLPLVTAQMREFGKSLCPMHIGVLLCGFLCGWQYGLIVGGVAPLLRFAIFGMPPLLPTAVSMTFELATYGIISGICYKVFPKKPLYVYLSLLIAMLSGRIVWGAVRLVLSLSGVAPFPFSVFLAEGFGTALAGISVQIIIIPIIVFVLKKRGLILN